MRKAGGLAGFFQECEPVLMFFGFSGAASISKKRFS
jgi:hypothetical protein